MGNDTIYLNNLNKILKDRFLDPWLYVAPGPLSIIRDHIVDMLEDKEARQRRRRKRDQETFEACIDVVVANLAHLVLIQSKNGRLALSRRLGQKLTSYDNHELAIDTFIRVLDLMSGAGIITQQIGSYTQGRRATTIAPTSFLTSLIEDAGVSFSDLRRSERKPSLILSTKLECQYGGRAKADLVGIDDTAETESLRAQVAEVNHHLRSADLAFIPDGHEDGPVDTSDRHVARHFSLLAGQSEQRFDQLGRLYGGFWLGLKRERRGNLRINGEPLADLDFKNLFVRLAYREVSEEPPEGDLYDVTGFLKGYDNENKAHRRALKKAFNSCLNGGKGGKRATGGEPGILDQLPKGTTAKHVRDAIIAKHPALRGLLETTIGNKRSGVGLRFMYLESQILLSALERLRSLGVVALPFHDGVMVPQSQREVAKRVMEEAGEALSGVCLPVEVK